MRCAYYLYLKQEAAWIPNRAAFLRLLLAMRQLIRLYIMKEAVYERISVL